MQHYALYLLQGAAKEAKASRGVNKLWLKPQRKARKPQVLLTHTYSPEARIAKRFRYCRNYAHETQKRPGMDAGARRIAPWTARFDGFVKYRKN